MERRFFTVENFAVETREENGAEVRVLRGHAAVFNSPSVEMWGVTEYVERGAFTKTIQEFDQRALKNHDTNMVLGRRSAGTLRLYEDEKGLAVEIDIPDTSYGRDLIVSAQRGDIKEMSFGFDAIRQRWEHEDNGEERTAKRYLQELRLFEVSPVTFPAYPASSFSVRSLDELRTAAEAGGPEYLEIINQHANMGKDTPVQGNHLEGRENALDVARASLWLDLQELI